MLKLEVGKKYIPKDSPAVKYVEITDINDILYLFSGNIVWTDGTAPSLYLNAWRPDGVYNLYTNPDASLVAEYVEPIAVTGGINIVQTPYISNIPYAPKFSEQAHAAVAKHTCVPVDTGFRKTWCRICDKDM